MAQSRLYLLVRSSRGAVPALFTSSFQPWRSPGSIYYFVPAVAQSRLYLLLRSSLALGTGAQHARPERVHSPAERAQGRSGICPKHIVLDILTVLLGLLGINTPKGHLLSIWIVNIPKMKCTVLFGLLGINTPKGHLLSFWIVNVTKRIGTYTHAGLFPPACTNNCHAPRPGAAGSLLGMPPNERSLGFPP